MDAVGVCGRGEVAGRVVGVRRRVVAGQTIIRNRAEPVQVVVAVSHRRPVRIGGLNRSHMTRRDISVAQSC